MVTWLSSASSVTFSLYYIVGRDVGLIFISIKIRSVDIGIYICKDIVMNLPQQLEEFGFDILEIVIDRKALYKEYKM